MDLGGNPWTRRIERTTLARAEALADEAKRLLAAGRTADAEAALREAAELRSRLWGPDTRSALSSRLDHAWALQRLQRLDDAEAELHQSLRECVNTLGSTDYLTLTARLVRVRLLRETRRSEEAIAEARTIMSLRADRTDHLYLAAWEAAATTLGELGRHAEAAAEFDGLVAAYEAVTAPGHPRVLRGLADRAQHLLYLGRFEQAEADCRSILATGRTGGPGAVRLRLVTSGALAFALTGRHRPTEAEQVARDALAEAHQHRAEHVAPLLHLALAHCLSAQRRHGEALNAAALAGNGYRQARPPAPSEQAAAGVALAAALLALGRAAEAEREARTALDQSAQALGPCHHQVLAAGTQLGAALAALGRTAEATEHLDANHAAWLAHFGPRHPRTAAAHAAVTALRRR